MSLETWKAEFYPVDARNVPKHLAINHSLQKWIGMRPSNLARHQVCLERSGPVFIYDGIAGDSAEFQVKLRINGRSCALCYWYLKDGYDEELCTECPLYQLRGASCDQRKTTPDNAEDFSPCFSPWEEMTANNNVEPMIQLLTQAEREYTP